MGQTRARHGADTDQTRIRRGSDMDQRFFAILPVGAWLHKPVVALHER